MSGLKTCDHDLLYPATVRPSCTAVNQIHEFECQDSTRDANNDRSHSNFPR